MSEQSQTESSEIEQTKISPAEAIGHMVGLCAFSGNYLNWSISDIGRLFIPPVLAGQCKLYFESGRCVAFATWAYLSEEWSQRVQNNYDDPDPDQWTSGDCLWIMDMVAPGRGVSTTRDLQKNVFRHRTEPGYALRRDETGAVRKIAKWAVWNSCPR
jgi:cytolysin-activating lysine-acyltransferase